MTLTDLIEVSDPGDVVLPRLADDLTGVGDDNGRVPECTTVHLVSLKNRRHYHHVVLLGSLSDKHTNIQ